MRYYAWNNNNDEIVYKKVKDSLIVILLSLPVNKNKVIDATPAIYNSDAVVENDNRITNEKITNKTKLFKNE